ncbi:MAG: hypothetical protein R3F17_15350 [Planctomycetota bacterium]
MHSWVFRNREHLRAVYAVAAGAAPLERCPLRPMQAPGQVLRDEEGVWMIPSPRRA